MAHDLMTRCQQRRQFMVDGKPEWRWKEVSVSEAIGAAPGSIRCKHCHGAVQLHRQQVEHGPQDHVEHRLHSDSESCPGGTYYKGTLRMSTQPVE